MLIRLTDIPHDGLKINDTISLSALNTRMTEGRNNDIEFVEAPSVTVTVFTRKNGAEVAGVVRSKYIQPCPRCLEPTPCSLEKDFNLILKQKPKANPRQSSATEEESWVDDVGITYFTGEHIDLEELVQETLILSISPFGLEHEGCKGFAGKAESEADQFDNTLAKRLKEAGIKTES
ncbi:DUF177 domain-containing protein [Oligoflexia bacterium]|nr:DUF177 domain-containing protein [Oligoflexia bacterium]